MDPGSHDRVNRREIVAAAAVAALPAIGWYARAGRSHEPSSDSTGIVPVAKSGPSAAFIPNVPVRTHTGRRALFYDDLVRGRIVSINFMSVRVDRDYPVTENLVKVQRLLGDRVGDDVFMYSITFDPVHDTPEVLADFARSKGVGPGWMFLTGDPDDLGLLRARLFLRRATPTGRAMGMDPSMGPCCSVGLVRYGNEALGRWGSFPARITPESIAKRFTWIGMRRNA